MVVTTIRKLCSGWHFRSVYTSSGGLAYSAGRLEAGFEGAVLFNRRNDLLKQGVEVVLAAVYMLLHARHKLLQVFFANNLKCSFECRSLIVCATARLNQPCWVEQSTLFH